MESKQNQGVLSMDIINPHAAGVDIGSRSHWVSIGQSEKEIREFGVFNDDLYDIAKWLKKTILNPSLWKVQVHTGSLCMQSS